MLHDFDGQKLTRKLVVGEQTSDEKAARADPGLPRSPPRLCCMSARMAGM